MEVAGPRQMPAIVVSNETAEPSELPHHSAPTLNTSLWKEQRNTINKGTKREVSVFHGAQWISQRYYSIYLSIPHVILWPTFHWGQTLILPLHPLMHHSFRL